MYQIVPFLILIILLTRCQRVTSSSPPRFGPDDGSIERDNWDKWKSNWGNLLTMRKNNDPFYPVADDDDRSSGYLYPRPIIGPGSIPKNPPKISQSIESEEREKRRKTEEMLIREIKMLFHNRGCKISDFRNIFLPNSSLFLDIDDSTTKSISVDPRWRDIPHFTVAPRNKNQKPWTSSSSSSGVDKHSVIEYKKRIKLILEDNRKHGKDTDRNKEELRKKLGELMRVIREIEYDDFSEVLKLIQNLNQGYNQNVTNSTMLIAMIQAAAQQWDETDSTDLLPHPFGTRNPSDPIIIPAELKDELLQLSNLLTEGLKHSLLEILRKAQRKFYPDIAKEIATIEEDSDGNVTLYIQNSNSSSEHIMRESLHARKPAKIIVDAHKEKGNDDDDFIITEEIVLDDADDGNDDDDDDDDEEVVYIDDDQDEAKKKRTVRANSGTTNNNKKNQVPYRDPILENIIREEQRNKLKRSDVNQKEIETSNVKDQDDDQVFEGTHRFSQNQARASRTKRVRKSSGSRF